MSKRTSEREITTENDKAFSKRHQTSSAWDVMSGLNHEPTLLPKKTVQDIFCDAHGNNLELRNLSVVQVFERIAEIEKLGGCEAPEDNIVMVIGNTRCGKSSLLNLILGNELKSVQLPPYFNNTLTLHKINVQKTPKIGEKQKSETTVPDKYISSGGMILWDCPGFGDNRSEQQEIINAYLINRLFTTAKGIKILNLIDFDSIATENPQTFLTYAKQIKDLFGDSTASINQCLVVTKISNKDVKLEAMMSYVGEQFFQKEEPALAQFFITNALYHPVFRPDKVGEIWNFEKVKTLVDLVEGMSYKQYNVNISISSEAKLYLHENASEISQAMINAYLKCFNGRELLMQFYNNIEKCAPKSIQLLKKSFDSNLISSYNQYLEKNNYIKQYDKFEHETYNFVIKVRKELNIAETVKQTKGMVEQYCLYEINYCATKHLYHYLKDCPIVKSMQQDVDNELLNISESHMTFKSVLTDISKLIELQKAYNKKQLDAQEQSSQIAIETAGKEYKAYCDEIDKSNRSMLENFNERMKTYEGINKASQFMMMFPSAFSVLAGAAATFVAHKLSSTAVPTQLEKEKTIDHFLSNDLTPTFSEYISSHPELLGDAFDSLTA